MAIDSRLRAALALIALAAPVAAQGAAPAPAPTPAPAASAPAAAPGGGVAAYEATIIAAQLPSYPMNTCIACGKPWGPDHQPVDIVRQGRLVRVGTDCVKAFDAQAVKWFKVLDDQIIAAQTATYPLTHCPVTNEELGKKPKYAIVGTRLIEVCCNDCKKELATNATTAAAAIAKIDEALVAAQAKAYPLDTCVVDGKPLGDTHVQKLYGVTLVRFCSDACQAKFLEAPRDYLPKLEAARKAQPAGKPAEAGR